MIACIGCSGHLLEKQKQHRDVLQSLISMAELLSGKIRYERQPMEEALLGLNRRYPSPAGNVLGQIADRLSKGTYENLEDVWRQLFFQEQKQLMLTDEELDIVLEMGKNLGYLDAEAQVQHLKSCCQQLGRKLLEAQRELEEKRKVYRYLGVAVGVMVVLILV